MNTIEIHIVMRLIIFLAVSLIFTSCASKRSYVNSNGVKIILSDEAYSAKYTFAEPNILYTCYLPINYVGACPSAKIINK